MKNEKHIRRIEENTVEKHGQGKDADIQVWLYAMVKGALERKTEIMNDEDWILEASVGCGIPGCGVKTLERGWRVTLNHSGEEVQ